jgi:membrane protease YdiL (CAAX protease family)
MPVEAPRRALRNTLLGIALLVCMAGLLYAYLLSIPARVAAPLTLAFAIEACLYAAACLEPARKWIEARFRGPALALLMTLSAPLPYAVYSLPTAVFSWRALAGIALAAAAVSFWYVALPRRPAVDLAFLALVAAGVLCPLFPALYPAPFDRLKLEILGQLMWTRLAIFSALAIAGMRVHGFSLLPSRKDWAAGAIHFALFLPVGVALGWATGFTGLHIRPGPWWLTAAIALATFFGMLWVVALREEFFFRGLLQEWLAGWLGNDTAGLVLAAILFGAAHLTFARFPNWRFALLATLAGLFYGRAYLTGRSVRAAMVAHALVNTAWRVFLS